MVATNLGTTVDYQSTTSVLRCWAALILRDIPLDVPRTTNLGSVSRIHPPSQNMTYELALMKAGKGKVSGVSGLDEGPTTADKEG